jgi:hypothetical protein
MAFSGSGLVAGVDGIMHISASLRRSLRQNAAACAAAILLLITFFFTRLPAASIAERTELASRFRFSNQLISIDAPDHGFATVRKVHPSLNRISAWVSATGAGISLADLDGDGFENDMFLVDPRINQLLIRPVPGTGDRFEEFRPDASPLPYDSETMSPTGTVIGDFNEDGRRDFLVHYWGRTPVLFLRKSEDPLLSSTGIANLSQAFVPVELVAVAAGQQPLRWFTHAGTQADIDGDGHLDLLIGNFFQDGADVLNEHGNGVATVMHAGKSKATNGGGAKLFLWQSASPESAAYRNETESIEKLTGKGWVLAAGAADLDSDGLPEIYLAHDFGPDRLLHNRSTPGHPAFVICEGTREFTTPKSFVLGKDSFKGMGVDFGDINGDGLLDIYVSNIADTWALQESHFVWVNTGHLDDFKRGIAPFTQESEALGLSRSGWGWDARLADFDNDGIPEAIQATGFVKGTTDRWPELHSLGTTNDRMIHDPRFWPRFQPPTADLSGHNINPFFVRDQSGRYVDVALETGIDNGIDPMNTRGISVADVDGDGRLDMIAANQWAPSHYFHNETDNSNNWLGLDLLTPANAGSAERFRHRPGHPGKDTAGWPAVGAVASLRLAGGKVYVAQVDGGTGHSGRRGQSLHFGLGRCDKDVPLALELRWRDSAGQLREKKTEITPGRHTIVLGNFDEDQNP